MKHSLSLENILLITIPFLVLTSAYTIFFREISYSARNISNRYLKIKNNLSFKGENYNASRGKTPYSNGQLYFDFSSNNSSEYANSFAKNLKNSTKKSMNFKSD